MAYQIAGVGEILWDVFPDGPRFGGAPANFCCSTASLATDSADVFMVSAVGNDQLGAQALDALEQRHVQTSMVQTSQQSTGRVLVELDPAGIASYRFDEDSAWDHLAWLDDLPTFAANCDAVCFGTLGQRSQDARQTIRRFLDAVPDSALRILDVNLRPPYFDDHVIMDSLGHANVLKLNEDELPVLAKLNGFSGNAVEFMKQIAKAYQLRCVALTLGEKGAIIVAEESVSELPGMTINVVDTVGAGDAFTASMTLDLLAGKAIDVINQRAITAAAFACTQPGATMRFPEDVIRVQEA